MSDAAPNARANEIPAWQSRLKKAIRANKRDAHNRYFQLATIGLDGSPRNRTVVFRGFDEGEATAGVGESGNDGLLIITDARSDKYAELKADNRAELSWYFTQTREQFRLRGRVTVIEESSDERTLRASVWDAMSDAAREQFFWQPPGLSKGEGEALKPSRTAPKNFLVLVFEPTRVDYLLLQTPQIRIFSAYYDGLWSEQPVNP